MSIARFIRDEIFLKRLREVVQVLCVYDPERRYRDICLDLGDEGVRVVDASESSIEAREAAMHALAHIAQPGEPKLLLVYVPAKPPLMDEERVHDPYAVYAACGAVFPNGDGDSYMSLCLKSKPAHTDEIRRLFADGATPGFDVIDNVGSALSWPTLRARLRQESPREILFALLAPNEEEKEGLARDDSWVQEAKDLLQRALGLKLSTKGRTLSSIGDELWRYVLFSEFAFDLPCELPAALSTVPRAHETHRPFVEDLCDRLRGDVKARDRYIAKAEEIENDPDLRLVGYCAGITDLGVRDTFPFEERTFLMRAVHALVLDDVDAARAIVARHGGSVWTGRGENQAQWGLIEAGLGLINACNDAEIQLAECAATIEALVGCYAAGLCETDRRHRELVQAVADYITTDDFFSAAAEHCHKRYNSLAGKLQDRFTRCLEAEGWPAPGLLSNSRTFDMVVAPLLSESGRRVAYIMVDALRYELGVALHKELAATEQTQIVAASAQLPTITLVGMASLLPGAGTGLSLVKDRDKLGVVLSGSRLVSVDDRMEILRVRYGSRFAEAKLENFIRNNKNKPDDAVELLVLRSVDIDSNLTNSPLTALKLVQDSLKAIRVAVDRLQKAGFSDVVIATDHGFALNANAEAGDVCARPPGSWILEHYRAIFGEGNSDAGNFVVQAEKVGARGDFAKLGGPRSMAPYRKGLLYFHGGASLQEAVVPVITVRLKQAKKASAPPKVMLSYKGGAKKITTRLPVVELAAEGESLFAHEETFEVLLAAYDKKNNVVGEAKPGGAVDYATGAITLKPGERIRVTVKMTEEYEGTFTLKALSPATGAQFAVLALETDYV